VIAVELPMKAFYRLLAYARPHRSRLASAFIAMVVYGAASAGLAALIQPIFDEVLPNRSNVAAIAVVIIAVYVIKGVGAYLSSYLMADVGQRVVRDIRNSLFRHILGQSASFFGVRTTGKLMSRIVNDVGQVQHGVSQTLGDLSRESLALIGYVSLLFYYDAQLALLCLTGAPVVVYPLVRFGQRIRRTTRWSQEAVEKITHIGTEAFTGHRIVKAFSAERREAEKFEHASQHLYRTNMKVTSVISVLPPLMELIGGIAFAGALWYGSQEIASGRLTTGEFTAFIAVLFLIYGPARKLSRVNANLQQAIAASERIFEIMDTHSEVVDVPNASVLEPLNEGVEFRDVAFAYRNDSNDATLQDVSFTVPVGKTLAIVGRSGAGKTTLVNLLPRFYDVSSGVILIDGQNIQEVTLESLRSQIGIVTQETVLFDDSVAANIAFGRPGASQKEIELAARVARAHEFISMLPKGYDTFIGERGQLLSGGQRQRLAIARALLRDSPLLILDEATSSLDSESEMLVQDALSALMLDRTCFVIAHRLSTVRRADMIIVLEDGCIVEVGTHDDLLAHGGPYAKLYELQFKDDSSDAASSTSEILR
tara:strand:- start:4774 stop:6558 length:1785 start_codon:yes stop_codon:yes gene_type:complete